MKTIKNYLLVLCIALILAGIASCTTTEKPSAGFPKNGNDAAQPVGEPTQQKQEISKQEISDDVRELLAKHKDKVKNIYYNYRSPQTGSDFYEFFVKGNKIKYLPYREIKALDAPDSYDSIFIDRAARTAQSYCKEAYCRYKGKKADLIYQEYYIPTIFDWIDSITQAQKVGEEVIDSKSAWKLETDQGTLWVDLFYGIPLKIESGGKTFRFEQIAANSVKDEDVNP